MRPVLDRIIARLDVGLCWEYTGSVTKAGYPLVGLGTRGDGVDYVHRVVFRRLVGPIPPKTLLSPMCRNRRCCNPDHMELITRQISIRRMKRRKDGQQWT